jgi:hypothetical protein
MAPIFIVFPYPSFFFRTLDENGELRFHHILKILKNIYFGVVNCHC